MPEHIRGLERDHRGYPIPWFVHRPADGSIDFRVMDPNHMLLSVRNRLCWVCGKPHDEGVVAFIGGPLSTAQGIYADPPSHLDCAMFSVKVCPFLAIPTAKHREANLPGHATVIPGVITQNPEVFGVLITDDYHFVGVHIKANPPSAIHWYCGGKPASRVQVKAAIQAGLRRDDVRNNLLAAQIRKLSRNLPLPVF